MICKSVRGRDIENPISEAIAIFYKGRLISEIQQMQRKDAISFNRAVQLITEKQIEAAKVYDSKKWAWYYENFVQYISDSGFHIELSGDEFVFHLAAADS